uniref:Protein kinase domain-containing protein n=1 Tax=Hyaloperonospora arabidopsidis (strain Emoy2) TaxID=559515 RepID=M4C6V0_HYAAE
MKRITFDELTFLRILSKGAYGEVWLGQLETRHVAIKRLLPEKCQLTASLEQFAGEIKLMGLLQHRNIVLFIGVCWNWLQNMCAVVEYMDAGDLDEILKRKREQFSWQHEKISIAMDITEGLVYLHCLRPVIVHRDLKPKNVLLNRDFQAKLSDFGVSRKTRVNETMTSGVGTLLWTAPEIIAGKKYSEKADIYSLGVLLSEMDTCEPPFSDVTSDKGERLPGMQLAQLVRLGKIRVTLRKDCPPKLCKLVMDCTQLDPDARPSSMQVAFTLKSIIAPTLRLNSSAATTASSMCPSSESQNQANQAVERPPPSEKSGVAVPTHI